MEVDVVDKTNSDFVSRLIRELMTNEGRMPVAERLQLLLDFSVAARDPLPLLDLEAQLIECGLGAGNLEALAHRVRAHPAQRGHPERPPEIEIAELERAAKEANS